METSNKSVTTAPKGTAAIGAAQPGAGQALQENPRLALNSWAKKLGVKPEVLMDTVSKTCFKACTQPAELVAGVIIADRYGLDPFLREFTVFPAKGGGVVPVVMIDGWIRLVQRQETYRGHKFVHHKTEGGKVDSITCEIHIEGRDFPIEKTEYMSECSRDTEPWKKWPIRMLEHKAFIQCARYAFGFGGIYDSDEAGRVLEAEYAPAAPVVTLKNNKESVKQIPGPVPAAAEVVDPSKDEWKPIAEIQVQELLALAISKGHTKEDVESYIKVKYEVESIETIPGALYSEVCKHWSVM